MKAIFAVLSLVFSIALFTPYFINMWKRTARPHIFTWITWTLLAPIAFAASFSKGGAGGSWIFALQGILCFLVVIYSIFKGEKNITFLDWVSFIGALAIALLYIFTRQAVLSVIFAATIDALGYVPTFRKSYNSPFSEPALTYVFAGASDALAIAAVGRYRLETIFYPTVVLSVNIILVCFLLVRRNKIKIR